MNIGKYRVLQTLWNCLCVYSTVIVCHNNYCVYVRTRARVCVCVMNIMYSFHRRHHMVDCYIREYCDVIPTALSRGNYCQLTGDRVVL